MKQSDRVAITRQQLAYGRARPAYKPRLQPDQCYAKIAYLAKFAYPSKQRPLLCLWLLDRAEVEHLLRQALRCDLAVALFHLDPDGPAA
jgi:hypothetical protein